MRNINEIKKELRGTQVCEFLNSAYTATLRMSCGSQFVYDVVKKITGASYTVRFQFVRLSFMNLPNQYRAFSCNCPRFHKESDCHHVILACHTHATSIGSSLSAETFADFRLSKINAQKLEKLQGVAA